MQARPQTPICQFLQAQHEKWFKSVTASITVKSAEPRAPAATARMLRERPWGPVNKAQMAVERRQR